MAFRESEIAVSNGTRWKLARIVAANQPTGRWDEKKVSVEALAEIILAAWLTDHHPELDDLWNEREAINDRAHKAVNEKATF